MATRLYHGSCHCRAVTFECDLDLMAAGTSRCNCSICWKHRFWKIIVAPAQLRVLSGRDVLTEYRSGPGVVAHFFCSRCGTKPFGFVEDEAVGGPFYAINVAALDDATTDELLAAPITYGDGKHDHQDHTPREKPIL